MTLDDGAISAVVPVLMVLFIRGKRLRPEEDNPISRFFQTIYLPVIRW